MPSGQLDWSEAMAALRRGRVLIVLAAVAVAVIAVITSLQAPATERVTSRLIVSPITGPDADFNVADSVRVLTQPGVMGTLSEILLNPRGLEQAAETAGITDDELDGYEVAAQEVPGSLVLEVDVEGPDADVAELLATGIVDDATALFDDLYPVYEVRVLDPPRPLGDPIQPSPVQFGVLGAMLGAIGASLLVIGWSRLRPAPSRRAGRPPPEDRPSSGRPPPPQGPDAGSNPPNSRPGSGSDRAYPSRTGPNAPGRGEPERVSDRSPGPA